MSRWQFAIPGSRPAQHLAAIQDELDEAVARVMRRAVFTPGVEVQAFEKEFAHYTGVEHAIGVASGGAAIMLALRGLEVGAGDEVISVPNVDISASAPIAHAGARPVWVDINPRTYNLDPQALEQRITSKTRAIIAVHMYGNPADMERIAEVGDRHGIPVVEDASLAPGVTYRGRRVGGIGKIGCFSCSPGKPLGALGKAGILVTNDAELAQRVRVLSNYGFRPSSLEAVERGTIGAQFEYLVEGFNARLDELQAAVLRVKLRHLDEWLRRRRTNAAIYRTMLSGLEPHHLLLPQATPDSEPAFRFFVVRSPRRDRLMAHLAEAGIWSGLAYVPPLHVQPVYSHLGYRPGSFPHTELLARELLCLPVAPELSEQEVEEISQTIKSFFRDNEPTSG